MRGRFVHASARYSAGLRWRAIDTVFENRILIGAVINSRHNEPHQFFENAREIVLDRVQDVLRKRDVLKINTVFNDEFVASDKSANKSTVTKNYELFRSTDLQEWYE